MESMKLKANLKLKKGMGSSRSAPPALSATMRDRLVSGRITGAEIGRLAGISKNRACLLLREGRTALEIVEGRRVRSAKRSGNGRPSAIPPTTVAPDSRTLAQLQRAKLSADVERRRLDLDERLGEMIPRSDVSTFVQYVVIINSLAVSELLNLPQMLRDSCDGRTGGEIERIWDTELRRLLDKFREDNLAAIRRYELSGVLTTEPENQYGETK
jgi:hypothetical protein